MGGDIPATLIRVSHLLNCGENVESIHACGLADDVETPESERTGNLTRTIPGVDLSKESGQWWVLYECTAAQQEIAVGESIKVLSSIFSMTIHHGCFSSLEFNLVCL